MATVGALVLLAGVTLAIIRFGGKRTIGLVLLGVSVIIVLAVVPSILVRQFAGQSSWWRVVPPILAVLGLVFGSMLIHMKKRAK